MKRRKLLSGIVTVSSISVAGCTLNNNEKRTPNEQDKYTKLPFEGSGERMEIIEVVDGDTVIGRRQDNTEEKLRFLGVDTPETGDIETEDWGSIADSDAGERWLSDWADKSTTFVSEQIKGETVYVVTDNASDIRGSYGRLLVYIYTDLEDKSLNQMLIEQGYARMYDSEFSLRSEFKQFEQDARESNTGLWGFEEFIKQSDGIAITSINEEVEGDAYQNLNKEKIILKNISSSEKSVSNWTIKDESGVKFTFPSNFSIQPNQSVTIHSGSGENTQTDLYWGSGRPIWNDSGDTIIIRNDKNNIVLIYEY